MTRVLYVEPVGGHRGMHYYDFALCRALVAQHVEPVLITCDETIVDTEVPFAVDKRFQGIYGTRPAWQRGMRYALALAGVLGHSAVDKARIVHLHYFHVPALDWLFVALCKARGLRVVITAHDVVPFDARPSDVSFIKRIYRLADRVIVHTPASANELQALVAVSPARVAVIPQGHYSQFASALPTPDPGSARERLGLPANGPLVLFFGQIKRVKGVDVLIRAFAHVHRALPDSHLVIAGPVWKDDVRIYESLIAELGLSDCVMRRFEYVPDEHVPLYFAAASVVALPYRKVYQSAVLFMAHSFARPVVATSVGGLAEVIVDGRTGYLVPPEQPAALAASLTRMLQDPVAAERMGLAGKQRVEDHYSWVTIAARIAHLYRQLDPQSETPRVERMAE